MKMNHELTAKWHELDKVRVGLKDVVVFRPDLRVADGYIQYSTDSGSTWKNLIALAELKGADGSKGDPGIAGQDGHSPVVTATKSGKTTTISVDGADIATVEDGVDGKPGAAGSDGITPHIGDNGNWYLGSTDTGKPSRGATGANGQAGPQGPAGPAGSDASVTAANIEAAMGYRPADPTKYLPMTGGKLTGNLEGKYITGTWLRSTDAGHQEAAATKVAVLDAQGWIYYRTPAELMADMGLADGTEVSY